MKQILWRPSPNCHAFNGGRPIKLIVIHATESKTCQSALAWLCDPLAKVSAHYVVDRDGTIYQLVKDMDIAWHTGKSTWRGMPTPPMDSLNFNSLGIELVNLNDGKDPYPGPQVAALTELAASLRDRYEINPANIVRHLDIALPRGRKNDPKGFPWDKWKAIV